MKMNETALNRRAVTRYTPSGRSREKHNALIRDTARECGCFGYEVAELLGCSIDKYTRMMRHEMPISEQQKIADLIRKEFTNDGSSDNS